jgi:hypothetical protein
VTRLCSCEEGAVFLDKKKVTTLEHRTEFPLPHTQSPTDLDAVQSRAFLKIQKKKKKKKALTENKTTQNRPKQHRARDETQKKEKRSARTSKAENTQKGNTKGKREKGKKRKKLRRALETKQQTTKGSLFTRA